MIPVQTASVGLILGILSVNPVLAQDQVKDKLIEFNQKCGPLSGKTPNQLTPEDRAYCEGLAQSVNQFLGFQDNNFVILPSVIRAWSGKPLQSLGGIEPCNKTEHVRKFYKYVGKLQIDTGRRGYVCTPPIPHTEKIRGLTCEAHGGGYHDACGNDGTEADGSWVITVTIDALPSMDGNKYCWWVYNQSSISREFSVSVR